METLTRLRALRAIGERLLTDRKCDLGFGVWDCGSHACLLGHYERNTDHKLVVNRYGEPGLTFGRAAVHFGITRREARALFNMRVLPWREAANRPGPEAYDELERRMARLDKIIARREQRRAENPEQTRAERPKLRAVG